MPRRPTESEGRSAYAAWIMGLIDSGAVDRYGCLLVTTCDPYGVIHRPDPPEVVALASPAGAGYGAERGAAFGPPRRAWRAR